MPIRDQNTGAESPVGLTNPALMTLRQVYNVALNTRFIDRDKIGELNGELRRLHTLGPILDPTAYRNNMAAIQAAERIVAALQTFRREVAKHLPDVVPGMPQEET